ncbi:MAG: glycosyltransferase [Rubripirellula sp.]
MKIACIIHSLDGGGAERVISGLASRLAQRGHHVTLVTLGDGGGDRHQVDPAVTRRRLDLLFQSETLWAKFQGHRRRLRELRATLTELAPDVVLSFCDRTNVLTSLSCPDDLPLLLSERSDPSQQFLGRRWEYLRDRGYPRATGLIALTATSAGHLRQRFDVPVTVIPSAVDPPSRFSDRTAASASQQVIGVGRLEPEKGFDRLIRAFDQALGSQPAWTLRILGEGSCRVRLEELVAERNLVGRVALPGWSSRVDQELAAATMFVLPSRYEGFPSALLEAMAIGVPSIAVDCESGPRAVLTAPGQADQHEAAPKPGLPDTMPTHQEGITPPERVLDETGQAFPGGLLIPNHEDSLADAIAGFASDGSRREAFGAAGKAVTERFSWDSMVDAYESLLRKAAHASRPQQ